MKSAPYLGTAALLIFASSLIASCSSDSTKNPPQAIVADDQSYIACRDYVWIDNEGGGLFGGGTTFRVKFTDGGGFSHVIKGIRKLHVTELSPTPSCH